MVQKKNSYVYGTAAEKLEYDVYEHNKVLKEKKKYKSNRIVKAKMVAGILLIFSLALVTMYRYALIADINFRISSKERQYEELRNENSRLKVAIENKTNLEKITQIAKNDLGMQKPDKYQIVHIEVPKNSFTVTSEQYRYSSDKNTTFLAELVNRIEIFMKIFS
ncbi:MAG: cell division protein FtsL [Clostridiaceae bacterium]|nr:cell division protein FtsL [Clostridiaceae bacterium]